MTTSLENINGVSSRYKKILEENGINSAEALAMSPMSFLEDMQGIGEKTAKKIVWNAREVLGMTDFATAETLDLNDQHFTTGSGELNRILGGGICTGKITEVYGPFKSGKTNLSHTVAVTAQLPEEGGGIDGNVVFIDTENTFSRSKIERIALRFGLDPKQVLKNIYHARIYSSDHQVQMILKSEKLCKEKNVRLVIVDSLMALLRNEFQGIGSLAKRQALLNNIIHALSRIAETYNTAVLVTNQVTTKMMGMFSGEDAIGGNIVAHGCHFRMMFKTKGFSANNSLMRRGIIVDAPDLPPEECEFYITSAGVADTDKIELPEGGAPLTMESLNIEPSNGSDLTDVKGLGAATADKLKKEGIDSIEKFVMSKPDDLAKSMKGFSADKIESLQKNARKLL